jgi:hypothetical protein
MKLSLRPISHPILGTLISLALVSTSTAALAAPDYGVKGPEAFTKSTFPSGTGGSGGGDLFVPNGAGPYPVIVANHGFTAVPSNQHIWAEHFASYGFVVIVPNLGLFPDQAKNSAAIQALPAAIKATVAKADVTRVGYEGHSAGALGSVLAASKSKPMALVLLDPVDDMGKQGAATFGNLCSPTLTLYATVVSSCNSSGAWKKDIGTQTSAPIWTADVVGATHCDGERGPRGVPIACDGPCGGGASPDRQVVHARHATAFFLANLKGDTEAAGTLTQPSLAAATGLADVQVKAGTPCPGAVIPGGDAGTPGKDGGTITPPPTGTTPPAGTGTPSPAPTGTAPDPSAESTESGCSASPRAAGTTGALLAGLVAAALFVRRRRS